MPINTSHPLVGSTKFARPSAWIASLQTMTTVGGICLTIYAVHRLGFAGAIAGVPILAGLIIRAFVLQHDCGHNSFFPSRQLNTCMGMLFSALTGMPFEAWKSEHRWHHLHQGNLDERGIDILNSPLTVEEAARDAIRKSRYLKLFNPLVCFFLLLPIGFLCTRKSAKGYFHFKHVRGALTKDIARGIFAGNILHIAFHAAVAFCLGMAMWALLVIPAYYLATVIGGWMFFIQHHHRNSYYEKRENWTALDVALRGSSYLRLPRVLAWFTADAGLHHVHHLNSRIPNYRLEAAREAIAELRSVKPIPLEELFKSHRYVLWNEQTKVMQGIKD